MKRAIFLRLVFFGLVNVAIFSTYCAYARQVGRWNDIMSTNPSEEHEYSFSLEQDGAVNVILSGASTMESQYAQVTLKDANGETMDWFYLTSLPASRTFYLAPGTYVLMVGKYRGDIYGEYDLSADFQAAGPSVSEAENNDDLSCATPVIEDVVYGSIGYQRQKDVFDNIDYYTFSVPADSEVNLEITFDSTLSSQYNGFSVLDSKGQVVDEITFLSSPRDTTLRLGPGTFYFKVFTGRNSFHGAYEISLRTTQAVNSSSEREINDTINLANTISDGPVVGSIGYRRSDYETDDQSVDRADWFVLDLPGGDVDFQIVVTEGLEGQYVTFNVYDENGLKVDYVTLFDQNQSLALRNVDPGTYFIQVYDSRIDSSWGGYTFDVEENGPNGPDTQAINVVMTPQMNPVCETISIDSSRLVDMDISLNPDALYPNSPIDVYFVVSLGDSWLSLDSSGDMVTGIVPLNSDYMPIEQSLPVFSAAGLDFSSIRGTTLSFYSGYIISDHGSFIVEYDCKELVVY